METTGGLFWDILLLSEYNEHWPQFYMNMINVLPCEKCRADSLRYHKEYPIPKLNNKQEKDQYIWELKKMRGGYVWQTTLKEKKYTLQTWQNKYKDKKFTKI